MDIVFIAIAVIIIIVVFSLIYNPPPTRKDVTRFLDIPIDGGIFRMARKIKAKGFKYSLGFLYGELNGDDVDIFIQSHKRKVYGITVVHKYNADEKDIIDKFNEFFDQFSKNKDYVYFSGKKIPKNENLSKNIKNKRYSVNFNQKSKFDEKNSNLLKRIVGFDIIEDSGKYNIIFFYSNFYNYPNI